jgi:hypothetical protein
MRLGVLSFVAGIGVSVLAAHAHHSIAGVYDSSRQVTVEGVVTQFQFINPHPFLMKEVKNGGAGAQQWKLEMDNRSELVDVGMNSQTFKQGDRVAVTGNPGRTQAQSLYIMKLDRPADGFRYEQVGSSPLVHIPSQ